MNYIILDLEWNQSIRIENANEKLQFEIIEIGAVRLNEDGVIVGEYSQLIKPQVYHELHRYTSRLIHMQMRELEHGKLFPDALKEFLSWCGEDYMFCSWGPQDLTELQSNMRFYGLAPLAAGPIPFLDVQKLFSLAFEDGRSRRTLEYAVDFLGIEKDIPFHRAFSDAYYAGRVLGRIPQEVYANVSYNVTNPPQSRKEEIHVVFENYAKYISRVFPNKTAALADREVISSKCYLCHKNLKKKIRWFTPNGRQYYCVAHCDKHGYMKGKLRIRRFAGDEVFVVKTTKFITPEDVERIVEKRTHAQEMRKRHRKNREMAKKAEERIDYVLENDKSAAD